MGAGGASLGAVAVFLPRATRVPVTADVGSAVAGHDAPKLHVDGDPGAGATVAAARVVPPGNDLTLELIDTLGVIHWGTWLSGATLFGIAVAVLAVGMSRYARALPRWLGWVGGAGGVLSTLVSLALVQPVFFLAWMIGSALSLLWLLAAGIWLLVRPPRIAVRTSDAPLAGHARVSTA